MADMEFKEFILYMLPGDEDCERLKTAMARKNMLESTLMVNAASVSPRPQWLTGVPVLVRQQAERASSGADGSAKPQTKRTAYRGKQALVFVQNYSEPAFFGGFVGSSTSGNEFDSVVYGYAKKGGGEAERIGGAAGGMSGGGAAAASLRGHIFNEYAYGHGVKGGGEARIAGAAGLIEQQPGVGSASSGDASQQQQQQRQQLGGGGKARAGDSGVSEAAQAYLEARSASDARRVQHRGGSGVAAAGYR
jgi:hypothetical protein